MKTLLTVPFRPFRSSHPQLPDLALGYLASMICDISHVRIIDWNYRQSIKQIAKEIKEYGPNIIGIKCFSINYRAVCMTINFLRKVCPESVIVLGGPHASAAEISEGPLNTDIIIRGEAEHVFRKIVSILKEASLKDSGEALAKMDGVNVPSLNIFNDKINLVKDLENLPFPKWDLINPMFYSPLPISRNYAGYNLAPIMATRGCPTACGFCSVSKISGKRIRKRSALSIFEEIFLLYQKYNVRQIMFVDNCFSADPVILSELSEMILDKKLEIKFNMVAGPGFYQNFDQGLLKKMKMSGLESVIFGIESASDRIRRIHNMESNVASIEDRGVLLKEAGIKILGFFMIGFSEESSDDISKTLLFSRKDFFDQVFYEIVSPFPGTKLYEKYLQEKNIKSIDWLKFKRYNINLKGTEENSRRLYRIIRLARIKDMICKGQLNKNLIKQFIKYCIGT